MTACAYTLCIPSHTQHTFCCRFTIVYFPSNLLLLTICTLLHKRMSLKGRICAGYAMLVLAVLMPVITNYAILQGSLTGTTLTFALVLVGAVLAGMGDGLAQGAVFADSSVLPPLYIQAVSVGTAAAGVLIFALRCVTKRTYAVLRYLSRIGSPTQWPLAIRPTASETVQWHSTLSQ